MFKRLILICIFVLGIGTFVQAQVVDNQTASIVAQNTFTSALAPAAKGRSGFLNISISGTWVGTVTLQRRFTSSGTYFDVKTWTANTEKAIVDPESQVQYRIGIKTGEYTSGTADVRLSRETGQ